MNQANNNWWSAFYDDLVAEVLLERDDPDEIDRTIRLLENLTKLEPGMRILDQCCGTGRLAIPLAKRGYQVAGVDLIPSYIERARSKAAAAAVDVELEAADAFEFTTSAPMQAVINWWTSFGYAPTDNENRLMLERARECLQPGGYFAMDFMNVPGVLHHFQPTVTTKVKSSRLGDITLVRESQVDVAAGVMLKTWDYQLADRQARHETRVRLYDPPTLGRLLEEAGFHNIRIVGDLDGSTITLDSPRCIIVGQRR